MPRISFRHAFVAVIIALAMLAQGTWALAGTTGNITGTVTDSTNGRGVADAKITAVAPSQSASTTTDASGHFTLLGLAPDTYTVSADKSGYAPVSTGGQSVFADQTITVSLATHPELKTIARVTSRAAGNLVKPGITSDTYSVNASAAQRAAPLGGGGNLDSAFSAMSSVPGVNVPIGGAGWNLNAVFIRGNQSFFTSFEYDGVPVNRAFDNYNSSTEASLGLQELQVYTGGGPASNSSAGTSGFVNQVIKTGTYPGFGAVDVGIGTEAFYHKATVEAGGASPNRNFSYYVGLSGYDQDYRYIDNNNGASLFNPGNVFDFDGEYSPLMFFLAPPGTTGRGDWPLCNPGTNVVPSAVSSLPWYSETGSFPGSCFIDNPAAALIANQITSTDTANIADRENVVNFHFGIPHHNGLRDDLQLMWGASAMNTAFYSSPNDAGGAAAYNLAVTGNLFSPYCPPSGFFNGAACTPIPTVSYPGYIDSTATYNLPFGTPIQNSAGVVTPPGTYLQPSSNPNRAALAPFPNDLRDTIHNDTGIVKVQYTKALGSNAYARLFGYTFYSDWTQAGANSSFNCYVWGIGGPNDCGVAANYDLLTHTAGGELQLADQLTPKHLLQLTANYTTASIIRFNNTGFINNSPGVFGGSPVGYAALVNGTWECFNPASGNQVGCNPGTHNAFDSGGYWGTAPGGILGPPTTSYPVAAPGTPAALAGAQWITLQNGDTSGTFNTVKPKFLFTSLTDEFRPSDRLNVNLGVRWDRYEYDLAPITPGTTFYAQVVSGFVCQNSAGTVLTATLKPGQPPPAPVIYTASCPAGFSHPAFSATSPSTYTLAGLSPRVSFTYTLSPDTVIRGEAGRYTQPPISASVQYQNSSGNALTVWNATLPLGFHSPFHPIPLMSALQSDLSLEHQFHGTDVTMKISPFYNYTTGYQQQSFIGPNFVTQVPVGAFRNYGVEFALSKGDFNREGLSGQVAVTYTDAKVQYESKYFGNNQMNVANGAIAQFNTLTSAGGGSQCYGGAASAVGQGAPDSCSDPHAIANPYFNMAAQPLMDPNGWYAPGTTGLSPTNNTTTTYFDSPLVAAVILNYKHQKFAITPSFQVSEGSAYGGPYDVSGLDPRACPQNSADAGITAASPSTNPLQCNYLTLAAGNVSPSPVAGQLFIPNPQTGSFAKPGQFRDPWIATMNLQLRYDVSPKVTLLATFANVFHTCFGGGSEPWTKGRYAPGTNLCSYSPNLLYTSNFFNGTSPADAAANGIPAQYWITQSYLPSFYGSTGSSTPWPWNVFFQAQVKL